MKLIKSSKEERPKVEQEDEVDLQFVEHAFSNLKLEEPSSEDESSSDEDTEHQGGVGERVDILRRGYFQPSEAYYVHIDVRNAAGVLHMVAYAINSFMLQEDAFDPRRLKHSPRELLEADENDTIRARRDVARLSPKYYEFWKVPATFPVFHFRDMVGRQPPSPTGSVAVHLTRIINNDDELVTFYGRSA